MNWIKKLKSKWDIQSTWQFVIIMIVFACTGFTVLFIKKPIVAYFSPDGEQSTIFSVLYYILILPTYNAILLFYGFVFGQFSFFWAYEKRMINRFRFRKKADVKVPSNPEERKP